MRASCQSPRSTRHRGLKTESFKSFFWTSSNLGKGSLTRSGTDLGLKSELRASRCCKSSWALNLPAAINIMLLGMYHFL